MMTRVLRSALVASFAAFVLQALPGPAFAQASVSAAAPSPAAAQYRLAAGDIVRISVYQNPDLTQETRITETGSISFPLLGNVALGGLTVTQAEQRIADGLRTRNFVKNPQVLLMVTQVRGNQASVLGQVGRPGRYPLETGDVRLTDLLATAGGIVPGGADTVVVVGTRNGQPFRSEVDLPGVFNPGKRTEDVILRDGDVVWVERSPQIYLYGEVQRPGVQRLERNMTLMQALASAGGVSLRGTEKGLRVHRKDAEGKVRIIEPAMTDLLKPDDVVYVKESLF